MRQARAVLGGCGLVVAGCAPISLGIEPEGSEQLAIRELLELPDHLQVPAVPEHNPLTAEKIELGRRLFYDRRLSADSAGACADCHLQELAFADGEAISDPGAAPARNSPSLTNVAYYATLTWASDALLELEDHLLEALSGDHPRVLGGLSGAALDRLNADEAYVDRFLRAFPGEGPGITETQVVAGLASFCRSLVSGDSAYDRYVTGDPEALTEQQQQGMALFNGHPFECYHCHGGINGTASYRDWRTPGEQAFSNVGLYDLDGLGSYPASDQGLYEHTGDPADRGFFRPPGLRNVALTAPYMHDGSIATLRGVVEHYAAGGRLVGEGPHAGDGRSSPLRSEFVRGFEATDDEIEAVVAFLTAFTDLRFVEDPDHADPFE